MSLKEFIKPSIKPGDIHPRVIGWLGTSSLAMGGSNQALFLIVALFVGQGTIPGQGSAAVPLLILGLLLSWAAVPGWIELILMHPNKIGGIAATCAEAFKPYSPILANLTGVCYWWGWVPTCGLTALLSAQAIHEWYLPSIPVNTMAVGIVFAFTIVNLLGVRWAALIAIPMATISATLAFISSLAPILAGKVNWHQAVDFHLTLPFPGWFGAVTSAMAGLYLVGFAAPAFEAATCHVGETINPNKNVPKAVWASAFMASIYFIVLPVVWLGCLGSDALGKDLIQVLGPTFAPVFGSAAKAAAIWFMMFNMFHGTLQPLAGAARTMWQLAKDGLIPEFFAWRSKYTDAPWVAILLTAAFSIWFLLIGDPIWLIASANFTYLIGIALPSIAVWLLRKDQPELKRPYRAPKGTIALGVGAAVAWGISAMLGFQQFGLKTVLIGLAMAYSGSALYAWRKFSDRRKQGLPGVARTLHVKLTGAMLLVLFLDGAGYLIAVQTAAAHAPERLAILSDIFVAVAMLTISAGLILPGMIAHSAVEISKAAHRLVDGVMADFSQAMLALGRGDLAAAHARVEFHPVIPNSKDEVGEMAVSFNLLQKEIARAAEGLSGAREGIQNARQELTQSNTQLELRVDELATMLVERERTEIQLRQAKEAAEAADQAKGEFLAVISHELRTPLNGIIGFADILKYSPLSHDQSEQVDIIRQSGENLLLIINDILDFSRISSGKIHLDSVPFNVRKIVEEAVTLCLAGKKDEVNVSYSFIMGTPEWVVGDPNRLRQVLVNLIGNAIKFTPAGTVVCIVSVDGLSPALISGQRCKLRFQVRDQGIGIAPDKLPIIFKPFVQANSTTTRNYGGTGLGLSISSDLVGLFGGHISVTSELGKGSEFSFTYPTCVSEAFSTNPLGIKQTEHERHSGGEGLNILVVEDNKNNQLLLLRQLEILGYQADIACDAVECKIAFNNKRYDLVLMDLQMPEGDGFEATSKIRAKHPDMMNPFICAVTANALASTKEKCLAVGMNEFLTKPVAIEDLQRILKLLANR